MAAITIRNLSKEAHRALTVRAVRNNRSPEAEVRAILEETVGSDGRGQLGSILQRIGQDYDITRADIDAIEQVLASRTAEPIPLD